MFLRGKKPGSRPNLGANCWILLSVLVALVALAPWALAQPKEEAAGKQPAPQAPPGPAAQQQPAAKAPEGQAAQGAEAEKSLITDEESQNEIPGREYTGERDPFGSLLRKTDVNIERPPGVEGMAISEIALVGIVRGQLGAYAIFLGTDMKAYTLAVGDAVYDGKVKSIADNEVIFEQQAFDAFGQPTEPKLISVYLYPMQ